MSDDFANLAQFNFGEKLVELIFAKLVANKAEIPFYEFYENHVGRETSEKFSEDFLFKSEVPLKISRGIDIIKLDVQSKIDVLAYSKCSANFAIEVKLGNSGGAESFPYTFLTHWKSENTNALVANTKDQEMIITGNMIHILDSNKKILGSEAECNFSTELMLNNDKNEIVSLGKDWWLVVRKECLGREFIKNPTRRSKKTEKAFENLSRVYILEDMWSLLSPIERNDILSELIILMKNQFCIFNKKVPYIIPEA